MLYEPITELIRNVIACNHYPRDPRLKQNRKDEKITLTQRASASEQANFQLSDTAEQQISDICKSRGIIIRCLNKEQKSLNARSREV